jgi:hypothetical protein
MPLFLDYARRFEMLFFILLVAREMGLEKRTQCESMGLNQLIGVVNSIHNDVDTLLQYSSLVDGV